MHRRPDGLLGSQALGPQPQIPTLSLVLPE
jgi:hypothetical protein